MVVKTKKVYQFKIILKDIKPKIWRKIQVPEEYSFWDLHVAIQNAMGWGGYHLHQFVIMDPKYGEESWIGIPSDDEFIGAPTTIAGWKKFIRNYFPKQGCDRCCYEYDFGDGWEHDVKLEKILPAVPGFKYPICIDGARACPPEDCGGIGGYENFLEAISNPRHEEHKSMLEWVGGSFDPEEFDLQNVCFENPKKALEGML